MTLPVILMVTMAFFKESVPPQPHNYAIAAVFLPVTLILVFILPIYDIHKAMSTTKERYLAAVSSEFAAISGEFFDQLEKQGAMAREVTKLNEAVQMLTQMYVNVERMPEWPLQVQAVMKIVGVAVAPLVVILLESYIGSLFG